MLKRNHRKLQYVILLELSILYTLFTKNSKWHKVEFSTFFIFLVKKQRVAKASMGLIPQPFLITIFNKYLNF